MNQFTNDKLQMAENLLLFLNANPAVLAKLPQSDRVVKTINDSITEMKSLDIQPGLTDKGLTILKNDYHDQLVVNTDNLRAKLFIYGRHQKDENLKSQTDFTISKLNRLPQGELIQLSEAIYKLVSDNAEKLTDYLVTPESISEYRTLIDNFKASIPQYRQSQLEQIERTKRIYTLEDLIDESLSELDDLVEVIKLSEPKFYSGYQESRKIITRGKTYLKARISITDKDSLTPIAGANINLYIKDTNKLIFNRITKDKGTINISTIPEGIYKLNVSKVGYTDANQEIVIDHSNYSKYTVLLSKAILN